MICETCHGLGRVPAPGPATEQQPVSTEGLPFLPCPDCGGCGIGHCCDGLTACNDPEKGNEV